MYIAEDYTPYPHAIAPFNDPFSHSHAPNLLVYALGTSLSCVRLKTLIELSILASLVVLSGMSTDLLSNEGVRAGLAGSAILAGDAGGDRSEVVVGWGTVCGRGAPRSIVSVQASLSIGLGGATTKTTGEGCRL